MRKGVLLERTYIHSRRLPLGLPAARDPMSRETPCPWLPRLPPGPANASYVATCSQLRIGVTTSPRAVDTRSVRHPRAAARGCRTDLVSTARGEVVTPMRSCEHVATYEAFAGPGGRRGSQGHGVSRDMGSLAAGNPSGSRLECMYVRSKSTPFRNLYNPITFITL